MSDDYAGYVEARYQGEIFGEAVMGALAELRSDLEEARKLRALEQLERETKELLLSEMRALGLSTDPDPEKLEQARSIAAQMGATPWRDFLQGMRSELPKLVADFEQAESLAPAGKEALLQHVTAHERALLLFTDAELAGDRDSLAPVHALLEEQPS